MPKWKSEVKDGQRQWVPDNEAAKLIQAKKDRQNGKITASELKGMQDNEKARVEKAQKVEQAKVAAEIKEREAKFAASYVPPTPRPGANAKFRERNERTASNA